MKLKRDITSTLTLTQDEFQAACELIRERNTITENSFLGTYRDPSLNAFIRELNFYLFTGENDK
jgi:hypothetical protein